MFIRLFFYFIFILLSINLSFADIIDDKVGDELQVLLSIEGRRGQEIPRNARIKILPDKDKTSYYVKIEYRGKVIEVTRSMFKSYLKRKRGPVFKTIRSAQKASKSKSKPSVKLSAIQEHYKGPPLTF